MTNDNIIKMTIIMIFRINKSTTYIVHVLHKQKIQIYLRNDNMLKQFILCAKQDVKYLHHINTDITRMSM